jgi:dienelactone hydrolase
MLLTAAASVATAAHAEPPPSVALATPASAVAPVVGASPSRLTPPGPAPSRGKAVLVPSLDRAGGRPVALPARWFETSSGTAAAPALVLLHGCGGMYASRDRAGAKTPRLSPRFAELAVELNAAGVHVLAIDSLSPRGETELCTQRIGERRVTQRERRRDALGALAWLARQPGVDASRLGLLGWSNGGSTVLAATNLQHPEVRRTAWRPSLAVAFYPGCTAEQARGYEPAASLLMLLGADDDWTPPGPCEDLARASSNRVAPGLAPQLEVYAGAVHGFDGAGPVRLRAEVPNGVRPGAGVHVGGDPAARRESRGRLRQFLQERWQVPS